ncbi:uncharacterized protein LOC126908919 [Daktulosphaira vitifoliae]|uniref:uncharacterized protein LOC126908919 n=1 Tax=Daktulosphaira vitifoliae TaxID=58002 RepID=UPI0021A9A202|nr:uncharacterized protein LOC126908919 [Daktulosphaira vitifoliae]
MFIKIYYFTFFIFWINQIDTTSYRLADKNDYTEYLSEVINYVRFQDEKSSMQHLTDGLMGNSDSISDFIGDLDYVQVCNNLKVFYDEAFKLEYINLGFHNLLHPTTPELVSPLYDDSSEYLAVNVINTLFNVDNGQSFINTKICVNYQIKDLNKILHDKDNPTNFFQRKQEVAHIFKCRYSELLRHVTIFLTAMQHLCLTEHSKKRYDNLITYVKSLKSTLPSVTTMINRLLAILALLKKASIGDYMVKSQSCFKNVVKIASEYKNILKNLNISLTAETNATNAKEFLEEFRKGQNGVTRLLADIRVNLFLTNYCILDKPLLSKFQLLESYQNIRTYRGSIFSRINSDLTKICEDFFKTDYDLCFSEFVN